jgi:GNAT superfamily N-acetyltransferase
LVLGWVVVGVVGAWEDGRVKPIWELPIDDRGVLVELDNDRRVRIRPIRAGDKRGMLAAFERLSEESRYRRFFSPLPALPPAMAANFTDVDDVTQLAWAVFDPGAESEVGDESGLAVAAARLFPDMEQPGTADATLVVVDDYQRKGLGRFLIELLVGTAALAQLHTLRFEVLSENRAMRALLGSLSATRARKQDEPTVVQYELAVPALDDADPTAAALYLLGRYVEDGDEPDDGQGSAAGG